ncbi:hypothetical protein FOA43_004709 [Brettanomyces nanus]|uniref:Sulfhydryl oxidase n=1 Tax=Eeniella nana TaxID=13502 RepID=A0A875S6U6_EENNA|nr:uncharacterized protein FOA43_004709 [Brettanomyces nanus]QPG77301.1 hypothetical protein FOA43_004709 [Brettanomyces nanus]
MKFLIHRPRSGSIMKLVRSPAIAIITLFLVTTILYVISTTSFNDTSKGLDLSPEKLKDRALNVFNKEKSQVSMDVDIPFMPKMGNETLRIELGHASWKLFHTILARYPDEPTETERGHLSTYIKSFAQVYPCGDCARHFVKLLKKYPPQLNSRKNAAIWGCFIHNQVNEVLHHPIYDCTSILEDYDCGCGADEESEDYTLHGKTMKDVQAEKDESEAKEHLDSIQVESKEEHIGG